MATSAKESKIKCKKWVISDVEHEHDRNWDSETIAWRAKAFVLHRLWSVSWMWRWYLLKKMDVHYANNHTLLRSAHINLNFHYDCDKPKIAKTWCRSKCLTSYYYIYLTVFFNAKTVFLAIAFGTLFVMYFFLGHFVSFIYFQNIFYSSLSIVKWFEMKIAKVLSHRALRILAMTWISAKRRESAFNFKEIFLISSFVLRPFFPWQHGKKLLGFSTQRFKKLTNEKFFSLISTIFFYPVSFFD